MDLAIRKQGAKGLLERSFFVDPTGKIRPSRLGVLPEQSKGSILDFLTEDITFKRAKPQLLLFEDFRVQAFPRALKDVAAKLKRGQTLTKKEADLLLEFQLRKSGKFKPLGFVSGESEFTLAPGEILKKVKTVGVTIVKGKKVPIVKTEVFKPQGQTKILIEKFKKNKLTKSEIKKLDKLLQKKTGFKYDLSSKVTSKKFVDIKRIGASSLPSILKRSRKPISRKTLRSRLSPRKPISRKGRSVPRSPAKRPPGSPPRSPPPRRPPRSPPPKGPPRSPPGRPPPGRPPGTPGPPFKKLSRVRKIKKRKTVTGYVVLEKRVRKFVKLKGAPLSKNAARDRLAYRIDNKISRTAKIVPVQNVKKLGKLPANQKGHFKKIRKNLRDFRVIKGKKFKLKNTYIERKGSPLINTKGEKRQLAINLRAKGGRSRKKKR